MISMRYAYNLANGNGLVWNQGERVEGMTNLLWTAYMSVFFALDASLAIAPFAILLSNLILNLVTILLVWGVGKRLIGHYALIAVLMLCLSLPYFYWSIAGFETSLLALLTTLSILVWLGWIRLPVGALVLAAVAYAVRPDSLVLLMVYAGCFMIEAIRKKVDRRMVLDALLAAVIIAAVHVFRWVYYGDIFPNTYYLKLTGGAQQDGLWYLVLMSPDSLFFMVGAAILYGFRKRKTESRWYFIVLLPVALISYVLYTGGDAFPYSRYFVPVLPFMALIFAVWLHDALTAKPLWRLAGTVVLIFSLFAALLKTQLLLKDIALIQRVSQDQYAISQELRQRLTPQDGEIAVVWAGSLPYFMPEYRFLDMLGKTDRHIARTAAHPGYYVGHNKWDLEYTFVVHTPSAVVLPDGIIPFRDFAPFQSAYDQNFNYVEGNGVVFGYWLRRDIVARNPD